MNGLTAELHVLATELITAGVPATVDPGEVLSLVTEAGVCALVEPAEVMPGMGNAALELAVPVRLLTAGPYDHHAVERLDEALLLALPIIRPREPVGWDTYDAADTQMPGRQMTTFRRIAYPMTIHP
jgi:hypothetical protein